MLVTRLALAIFLLGAVPLLGADPAIQAEVLHPVVKLHTTKLQDRLVYGLKFDLRLT